MKTAETKTRKPPKQWISEERLAEMRKFDGPNDPFNTGFYEYCRKIDEEAERQGRPKPPIVMVLHEPCGRRTVMR